MIQRTDFIHKTALVKSGYPQNNENTTIYLARRHERRYVSEKTMCRKNKKPDGKIEVECKKVEVVDNRFTAPFVPYVFRHNLFFKPVKREPIKSTPPRLPTIPKK